MLTELCQELRNYFDVEHHTGTFEIANGNINASFLRDGQYFRIIGSIFNDGVHQYPAWELTDETFTGSVWAMGVPREVIKLSEEIDDWRRKYEVTGSAAMSPFTSESFGGYSYTKASASSQGASVAGWKTAFASRLNRWRKL